MSELHGFELIEERDIAEINSHARLFRHIQTGAELLSLENDDDNKSFMVAFRTPPSDDTGLPHIMEHSVLCGSRKYPVKDPFATLIKTSLNTFMNAMTMSDATVYPVASANLKDFYNLVDVYLDSVFFPLIPEQTLMQEGWHLETDGDDAPLNYRGIVYNEMKSYAATPEIVLDQVAQTALLPDTPYAFNAGGDPTAIPDLSYEQFKAFHETYYHPSNARIIFSGDDDPMERLRIVDEFLSEFERKDVDADVPLQQPFDAPTTVEEGYDAGDADPDSNKTFITMNWLLPEITQQQRMMELSVLSYALIGTPASPLRKALVDSGLGEDLTGSGLNGRMRQAVFEVGMKGTTYDNAPKVEALILETLGQLAEEGIERETVEAALNTMEFRLRERNTGRFPRGLMSAFTAFPLWANGGNPLDALEFEERLAYVKQQFSDNEQYFQDLIGEFLVQNTHRTTVILRPDPEVGPRRDTATAEKLAQLRSGMGSDEITQIMEQQEALRVAQETPDSPEDIAKLPTLTRDDIEREVKVTPQEISSIGEATVYYHEQPTAGIAYVDLGFDLYTLPERLLPYVNIFGTALTQVGTEAQDYVQLIQRIGRTTGGIYTTNFNAVKRDHESTLGLFFVRGKVTSDQTGDLLDLFRDILLTVKLDNKERLSQIVRQRRARFEQPGPFTPTGWAAKRLQARFNVADWADEQMSGVSHLFFLRELVERIDNDWDSVLADLEALREALLKQGAMIVNATMEADTWASFKPQLEAFVGAIPAGDAPRQAWGQGELPQYEGLSMPLQVNFVGKAARLYDLGYELHGSEAVIFKHMNMDYMWNRVRMQGGAYGGRAGLDGNSGILTFLSWSDPNLVETLKVYEESAAYLSNIDMSEDDLEQAIIGAIGDLDGQDLPDSKGFKALLRHQMGLTTEMRQQYRDELLATTLDNFKQMGAILAQIGDHAKVTVVGGPEALNTANEKLDTPLNLTKIN